PRRGGGERAAKTPCEAQRSTDRTVDTDRRADHPMGQPAALTLSETAEILAAACAATSPGLLRERVFEPYAGCCILSARRLALLGALAALSGSGTMLLGPTESGNAQTHGSAPIV